MNYENNACLSKWRGVLSAEMHQPTARHKQFQDGRLTLIHDRIEHAIHTFDDETFDLILTSPPYWRPRLDCSDGYDGEIGCEEAMGDYIMALVPIFNSLSRVLAPHGLLAVVLGDSGHATEFGVAFKFAQGLGGGSFWHFQRELVLIGRSQETDNKSLDHEYVLIFSRSPFPLRLGAVMQEDSVIHTNRGFVMSGATHLPLPITAVRKLLITLVGPPVRDASGRALGKHPSVLDPFAGVGTVGHIAVNLGYRATCVDIDEKNFEVGCAIGRGEDVKVLER